jgi:hypothetical protein
VNKKCTVRQKNIQIPNPFCDKTLSKYPKNENHEKIILIAYLFVLCSSIFDEIARNNCVYASFFCILQHQQQQQKREREMCVIKI